MSHRPQPRADSRRGRPAWVDPDEYPFEPHALDLDPGRVSYVDEGEGRPLVMLHGNPTWSFLYRKLIERLAGDYRCVAPDLLGFGLSEKPREFSYRVSDHVRVVASLVEALELEDVTLVVHDWGGPIGMDYAAERPDNVDSFVVTNTVMWPPAEALHVRALGAVAGSRVGRFVDRRYDAFVNWAMPAGFADRSRLTPEIHRHYRAPLADPDDREGSWMFARELLRATGWLADLWERRSRVAGTPALLAWGLRDPVFRTNALRRWQALFPDARTLAFPDAGHFVHEERGEELAAAMREFC